MLEFVRTASRDRSPDTETLSTGRWERGSALPVFVLAVVSATAVVSFYFSAEKRAWLLTATKGRPLIEEQVHWWLVSLPLAIGAALILVASLIAVRRSLAHAARRQALEALCVGFFGVVALFGLLRVGHEWRTTQTAPARQLKPKPSSPNSVFRSEQWQQLAQDLGVRWRHPQSRTPQNRSVVGIPDRLGAIPYDPFLLRRVSFVGLRVDQVVDLLGPPIDPSEPKNLRYEMANSPAGFRAGLTLTTGIGAERRIIRRQQLSNSPTAPVCGYIQ